MNSPLRMAAFAATLTVATTAFAQDYGDPLAAVGDCRAVPAQANIDGSDETVVARACLQADGSWLIIRDDAGSDVIVYPVAAYPYPDPWYWGPPIFVGIGASFVFIDRFHHFHHFHRPGHVHFGGFHAYTAVPHTAFMPRGESAGGTHGFGGGHHR